MSPQTDAAQQKVLKRVLSEAQRLANRLNAQKSTGPKTPEGKAKSALNACRHQLTGQVTTMTEPDRVIYNVFLEGYMAEWKPEGATEIQLVTRIAHDNWRLNRAGAIEDNLFAIGSGDITYASDSHNYAEIEDSFTQARTYRNEAKTLQLLSLYEQRTTRTVHKNIELLKKMQAERFAKEAKQMEEAKRLLQLNEMRNLPYDPAADGFVFSTKQIHAAIDRDRRLKHTADPEFGRMNGRQRRKLRQMMSTTPQTKAA
jgi:hypothetical protein